MAEDDRTPKPLPKPDVPGTGDKDLRESMDKLKDAIVALTQRVGDGGEPSQADPESDHPFPLQPLPKVDAQGNVTFGGEDADVGERVQTGWDYSEDPTQREGMGDEWQQPSKSDERKIANAQREKRMEQRAEARRPRDDDAFATRNLPKQEDEPPDDQSEQIAEHREQNRAAVRASVLRDKLRRIPEEERDAVQTSIAYTDEGPQRIDKQTGEPIFQEPRRPSGSSEPVAQQGEGGLSVKVIEEALKRGFEAVAEKAGTTEGASQSPAASQGEINNRIVGLLEQILLAVKNQNQELG